MHLPIRMVEAYATDPPKTVMTPRSSPRQQLLLVARTREDKTARSNAHSSESDTDTANGEDEAVNNDIVGAIHYKHQPKKDLR